MLTNEEVEALFAQWATPEAGRRLIRDIRSNGPVRALQYRMDTVRTRLISKKMSGRALYAESRTVELPAVYLREHDKNTLEVWPQPCSLDLSLEGDSGKLTRVQHTPDLFLITEDGFVVEEWREEARLLKFAAERPRHFYKDDQGTWHYHPVEEYLAKLGINYRLRSADEHPRIFIANLRFLEDYNLESTPAVPESELARLLALIREHKHVPHLQLVYEHKFLADHIWQAVLNADVYVDLAAVRLSNTDDLVIYSDALVSRADQLLRAQEDRFLPPSAYALRVGSRFLYDGRTYEIVLLGEREVVCRDSGGQTTHLPLSLVDELFQKEMLLSAEAQSVEHPKDVEALLVQETRLREAMKRLDALANPEGSEYSARSLRRFRAAVRGVTSPQDQLQALMSMNDGNRQQRLPDDVLRLAERALQKHNVPANPTIFSTYQVHISLCEEAGVQPMGQTSFYRWVKAREDIAAREGKRKKYQKEPIPLTFDYEHPVHGVLPHEVAYCDHTTLNVFLRGSRIADLGKPTLTVMLDGAMTKTRAFFLSYRPPGTMSVLMCLRDYVRRNKRLPRVLVLDNGREFHSEALKAFCSVFSIEIRWRRRSRPRDSSKVERLLGATEMEVLSSLDGNSLAMKDPRMVSPSHHPDKHIKWTLPALHGSLEHYFFKVHPERVHPSLGMSPNDFEKRQLLELGAREHIMVRYDEFFKLLTSPHTPGKSTRVVDRMRGVFVDGEFYWHDQFRNAKRNEQVEVRIEPWNARVVYVNWRNQAWLVAQARDGGRLEGRFRQEFEQQKREEARRSKSEAARDKRSARHAKSKLPLWTPEHWDPRLREELAEEYYLYDRLGMVEALPLAKNEHGETLDLRMPRGSGLELIRAVQGEPDVLPSDDGDLPPRKGSAPDTATTENGARPTDVGKPLPHAAQADDYF